MTLVEVMVVSAILLIVVGAALMALVSGTSAAYIAAQHTSAMGLCEERMEELRAAAYENVDESHFPREPGLRLMGTEPASRDAVLCERTVAIQDESEPDLPAKRVVVSVQWTYRGQDHQERLESIVHDL